jgi:hypothetical protein
MSENTSHAPSAVDRQVVASIDALSAKVDELVTCIRSAHPEFSPGQDTHAKSGGASKVKRTRTKSAYNVHMSKQLSELKQTHPQLGHRQRFAMAVKSWPRSESVETADAEPEDGTGKVANNESPEIGVESGA